jgi:ArsR family metal-binding transcriptional regulator
VDKLIEKYSVKIVEPGCAPGSGRYGIQIDLVDDISAVLPYLNAQIGNGSYDHANHILIWREPSQAYPLHPKEIRIARIEDSAGASQIASELIDKINQVWQDKGTITPCFTERKVPAVIDLFKLLPRTNCKQCGFATCLAYADALRSGQVRMEDCRLLAEAKYANTKVKLESLLKGGS